MTKKILLPVAVTALFLMQLCIGFFVVESLNRNGVVTGEEVAVTLRDVAMIEERLQHNPFATTFGLQAFYWVGTHVAPNIDVFYGRWWKAAFMALMPPVVFLYGRRRLGLSALGAATAGVVTGLLPLWLAYTWLTGPGLEILAGLGALLLLATRRPAAIAGSAGLMALSPMLNEAGFAFFPAYLLELYLYWRETRSRGRLLGALGAAAATGLLLLVPALYWTNDPRLYLGGGELVADLFPLIRRNGALLLEEIFLRPDSYYNFSNAPAFSNFWLAGGILLGGVLSARKWRAWAPLYLTAAAGLGIFLIAGGVPGIRRALIVLPVGGLFAGSLVDEARGFLARGSARKLALPAAALLAASFVAGPLYQGIRLGGQYARGEVALPRDLQFPALPGKTIGQTIDALVDDPQPLSSYRGPMEPTLVYGILAVTAERRGKPTAGFFRSRLLEFWRRNETYYRSFGPRTTFD